MFQFVLFLSFLTLVSSTAACADQANLPQSSVRDRIKQLEKLPSQTKPKFHPQERKPRPLPVHPSPQKAGDQNSHISQTEPQKEKSMGDQKQHQTPPRPQRSPPSLPIHRGGEKRHGCQKTPPGHLRILAIDGGGVRGLIPA